MPVSNETDSFLHPVAYNLAEFAAMYNAQDRKWPQVHLIHEDVREDERRLISTLSWYHGTKIDRTAIFRLHLGLFDEALLERIVELRHLSVIGFRVSIDFFEHISRLPLLYSLHIGHCEIAGGFYRNQVVGGSFRPTPLPRINQLSLISLDHVKFSGGEFHMIAESLCVTWLKELIITGCSISDSGAEDVANIITKPTGLVRLDLDDNEIGDIGAKAIATKLPWCEHLAHFNVGDNAIGDDGMCALTEQFVHLKKLETLKLGPNWKVQSALKAIVPRLKHFSQLSSLSLKRLNCDNAYASLIANCFHHLPHLRRLDFSDNRIARAGSIAIAKRLHNLGNLKSLNLRYNRIDDEGIQGIAEAYRAAAFGHMELDLTENKIRCVDESLLNTKDAQQITETVLIGVALPFARVMLVGMGEVGKTWLPRRCFRNEIVPKEELRRRTENVDIIHSEETHFVPEVSSNDGSLRVETYVWDFGGQAVKHGVHEVFLVDDRRTVFLLIMSARREPGSGAGNTDATSGNRLVYWLKTLRHFVGPNAPIVIAITQCDPPKEGWHKSGRPIDVPLTWDDRKAPVSLAQSKPEWFQKQYGVNVVQIVDQCSATDASLPIEPLQQAIRDAVVDHTSVAVARVPAKYPKLVGKVKRKIQERTLADITEYRIWCKSREVDLIDPTTQMTFLRLLNDHGLLFFFGHSEDEAKACQELEMRLPPGRRRLIEINRRFGFKYLESTVINPDWMKQCVYQIIDDSESQAWFSFDEDIRPAIDKATKDARIRRQERYSYEVIQEFLIRSQLCWDSEKRGRFLFPRGLPAASNRDLLNWMNWPSAELVWDFLPEPNFFRLLVELHEFVIDGVSCVVKLMDEFQHGRNWIHIRDPHGSDSEAIVLAHAEDGRIVLRFRPTAGATQEGWRELLMTVRLLIEKIQGSSIINEPIVPLAGGKEANDKRKLDIEPVAASRADRVAQDCNDAIATIPSTATGRVDDMSECANPRTISSADIRPLSSDVVIGEVHAANDSQDVRQTGVSSVVESLIDAICNDPKVIVTRDNLAKPISFGPSVDTAAIKKSLKLFLAIGAEFQRTEYSALYPKCSSLADVVNVLSQRRKDRTSDHLVNWPGAEKISNCRDYVYNCRKTMDNFFMQHFGLEAIDMKQESHLFLKGKNGYAGLSLLGLLALERAREFVEK